MERPGEAAPQWQFYTFLTDYHETLARHNKPAKLGSGRDVTAVLDGQQRLTSLVIGLVGTYAYRLPNKRRSNSSAYWSAPLGVDRIKPLF